MAESFSLDGLAINDGTTFRIVGDVDMTPPRQRQEWIGASDSEWQALARAPLHENREISIPLEVVPTATKDLALDKVGQIVDKLRLASRTDTGIALTWSPDGSSRTVTFDVLAGEITGLPLDFMFATSKMPRPTLRLMCKPYWRGSETTTSTASTSTPFVTLEVAGVPGDIPALGRLIVTDTATQNRRHVEWGVEGQYYNASTSLLVDSDDMVTSGFAGVQNSVSGGYDPNATGNNVVTVTVSSPATTIAVAGLGNLSHVGSFRVKARLKSSSIDEIVQVRLAWRFADGPYTTNSWVTLRTTNTEWEEHDLGVITVPQVISGTQRWTGQIEAQADASTVPSTFSVDYLILVPAGEGYGRARAVTAIGASVPSSHDAFTSTTAAAALGGTTADGGGVWATSGDATDLVFSDLESGEQVTRSAASATSGRFAVLGTTTFTDSEVRVDIRSASYPAVAGEAYDVGVIGRWTDASNFAYGVLRRTALDAAGEISAKLVIAQVVAGVTTTIAAVSGIPLGGANGGTLNAWNPLRMVVYATGRAVLQVLDTTGSVVVAECEGSSTALATGGTLASGKAGFIDKNTSTTAFARYYDNFYMGTPAAEQLVVHSSRNMQIRHDDVFRQDSTGTYVGQPPSYRGSRFLVPVGTSRVLVKARRNDVEASADANVTDATQIQVAYTSRGLAVPR